MVYDSITNVSIPPNSMEFGKKKRVKRTAKLKQSKLDVRREQWLSQMKKKECKEKINSPGGVKTPPPDVHSQNDNDSHMMKLKMNKGLIDHYSDSESPSNSPISHTSSLFGSHFTSSSSGGCCSESVTEEDDVCLDDWEAIADALAADEIKNSNLNPNLQSPQLHEPELLSATSIGQDDCCARAWRSDDVFRPHNLPNLPKHNIFPINSEQFRGFKNVSSHASSCPICCEELDMTDTSFLPCPCGYRLCLFCHKRILEDDGRCPGCRKKYDHHGQTNASLKLARSYSMIPRH